VLLDYLVLPPLVGAEEDIVLPLPQRYLNEGLLAGVAGSATVVG
jgi:hypothetical protein